MKSLKSPAFLLKKTVRSLYKKMNIGHKNTMGKEKLEIQDEILLATLEDVPFDGWAWPVVENAALRLGYTKVQALNYFPRKVRDVLVYFSNWADRQMVIRLEDLDGEALPVRSRIAKGVQSRLEVLAPHKEAFRASTSYWLHPLRKATAGKMIWRTADKIWLWAGDKSMDYNHYTKRTLLSGVLTSTMLAWLNDESDNFEQTLDFLSRRIDNVLTCGKFFGGFVGRMRSLKASILK